MAIKAIDIDTGAPAAPAIPAQDAPRRPGVDAVNTGVAPDPSTRFLNMLGSTMVIDEGANTFINRIEQTLTDPKLRPIGGGIKIQQLRNPGGCFVVTAGKFGIILIMAAMVQGEYPKLAVAAEREAAQCFPLQFPDTELVDVIVVSQADYAKVNVFSRYLYAVLDACVHNKNADITNNLLRQNGNIFTISDNAIDFENFMNSYDPHGVPLRHDLTLTLYVSNRDQPVQQVRTEVDKAYGIHNFGRREVAAVSGYVEFVRDINSTTYRFLPVIHISDIKAAIPVFGLGLVMIYLAEKRWIKEGMWKEMYRRHIAANPTGKVVNIGALVPGDLSQTGETTRFLVKNDFEFNQFVSVALAHPQLVVDVNEGRAKIPGFEKFFGSNISHSAIVEDFNRFYGKPVLKEGMKPCDRMDIFWRGTYQYAGRLCDTQHIDFLNEFDRHPTDAAALENLCYKYDSPELRYEQQSKWEKDIVNLYLTQVVSINPEILVMVHNDMRYIHFDQYHGSSGFMPIDEYQANALRWQQAEQNNMYAPGAVGGSGFGPVWGAGIYGPNARW
jgi:hypothetical protein